MGSQQQITLCESLKIRADGDLREAELLAQFGD